MFNTGVRTDTYRYVRTDTVGAHGIGENYARASPDTDLSDADTAAAIANAAQVAGRLADHPEAPDDVWVEHFRAPHRVPEMLRPHLIQRVLTSPMPWVNLAAAPGTGRTTLLRQISATLRNNGERCIELWSPRQVSSAAFSICPDGTPTLTCVLSVLRDLAATSRTGRVTVILDDADLTGLRHIVDTIMQEVATVPELRLITATYNPIELSPNSPVLQLTSADLVFSHEETRALCEASAATLSMHGLDERVIDLVHETTRGTPLGVIFKLDRLQRPNLPGESGFAQMMQAVHTHLLRHYPADVRENGFAEVFSTFSLMPRFTDQHLAHLYPGLSSTVVREVLSYHLLEPKRAVRPGEHVWCTRFWHAASQWNLSSTNSRLALADRLREQGYITEAFEQWFLAGDHQRAERVLRAIFLTIHETITPETAREICDTPSARLRGLPLLLALQTLLDPHTDPQALDLCAENLRIAAERAPHAAAIPLAVRAVVLTRRRLQSTAIAQAQGVLSHVEAVQQVDDSDPHPGDGSEAALIAALTMLACETYPAHIETLPGHTGSHHLNRRRALAQQVIDSIRLTPRRHDAIASGQLPAAYRSLIFSVGQCVQEVLAFERYDRAFHEAFTTLQGTPSDSETECFDTGNDAEEVPRLPYAVARFARGFERLRVGNVSGAISVADELAGVVPTGEVLRALIEVFTARNREALQRLDALGTGWGARSAATAQLLRATALLHLGHPEAAEQALIDASALPDIAVVQSLALLPDSDTQALVALAPSFAPHQAAAAAVGALGSRETVQLETTVRPLTKKERSVLEGLRRGLNTREIADEGFLSVNTVRTHVRSVSQKLGASGQAEILRRARELGMLD